MTARDFFFFYQAVELLANLLLLPSSFSSSSFIPSAEEEEEEEDGRRDEWKGQREREWEYWSSPITKGWNTQSGRLGGKRCCLEKAVGFNFNCHYSTVSLHFHFEFKVAFANIMNTWQISNAKESPTAAENPQSNIFQNWIYSKFNRNSTENLQEYPRIHIKKNILQNWIKIKLKKSVPLGSAI